MRRPTTARAPSAILAAALALLAASCGDATREPPTVAVVGAFPAELGALVERATIEETVRIDGRTFRVGRLGGVRVVLAMTGIGLLNATATTQALLDHFAVDGVVFSGVAGSPYRIGDVAVPEAWAFADGDEVYPCEPAWLEIAARIDREASPPLDACTRLPAEPATEVCVQFVPIVAVGGLGTSSDPFGTRPFQCFPDGDDVFGCELGGGGAPPLAQAFGDAPKPAPPEPVTAVDMESAAVARETDARGLKFIAFRGVSDGEEDPLDLPGFPAQFFAYYRLAAANAAAATTAFLEQLARR